VTSYVLDASALLRFTDKETGFERVQYLLVQAAKGSCILLLSAVNWGEIVAAIFKRANYAQPAMLRASALMANLLALPLTVIPATRELAEDAAMFKCTHKVPFADAFAGSLALHENATLVTADYDFKRVPPGIVKIDFLPSK
jgi:predicted nucleic acid-binding protein